MQQFRPRVLTGFGLRRRVNLLLGCRPQLQIVLLLIFGSAHTFAKGSVVTIVSRNILTLPSVATMRRAWRHTTRAETADTNPARSRLLSERAERLCECA